MKSSTKNRPDVAELIDHLDHMQRRVVQDAMREAQRSYWLKRADDFRVALPKQSDWHGHEGLAGVRHRRERLLQIIAACEVKAKLCCRQDGDFDGA